MFHYKYLCLFTYFARVGLNRFKCSLIDDDSKVVLNLVVIGVIMPIDNDDI